MLLDPSMKNLASIELTTSVLSDALLASIAESLSAQLTTLRIVCFFFGSRYRLDLGGRERHISVGAAESAEIVRLAFHQPLGKPENVHQCNESGISQRQCTRGKFVE